MTNLEQGRATVVESSGAVSLGRIGLGKCKGCHSTKSDSKKNVLEHFEGYLKIVEYSRKCFVQWGVEILLGDGGTIPSLYLEDGGLILSFHDVNASPKLACHSLNRLILLAKNGINDTAPFGFC